MMMNAKVKQIEAVNSFSRKAFEAALASPDKDAIVSIDRLTKVQTRIQGQKEWPFEVYTLGPLGAALATAAAQIVIALVNLKIIQVP